MVFNTKTKLFSRYHPSLPDRCRNRNHTGSHQRSWHSQRRTRGRRILHNRWWEPDRRRQWNRILGVLPERLRYRSHFHRTHRSRLRHRNHRNHRYLRCQYLRRSRKRWRQSRMKRSWLNWERSNKFRMKGHRRNTYEDQASLENKKEGGRHVCWTEGQIQNDIFVGQ